MWNISISLLNRLAWEKNCLSPSENSIKSALGRQRKVSIPPTIKCWFNVYITIILIDFLRLFTLIYQQYNRKIISVIHCWNFSQISLPPEHSLTHSTETMNWRAVIKLFGNVLGCKISPEYQCQFSSGATSGGIWGLYPAPEYFLRFLQILRRKKNCLAWTHGY
jgi:hypothetical protein